MKLPLVFDANWICTWRGAFTVDRMVDVFCIGVRNDNGIREAFFVVFNVGFRLAFETRRNYGRRMVERNLRTEQLVADLLSGRFKANQRGLQGADGPLHGEATAGRHAAGAASPRESGTGATA